jgi:hypothetical protein
MQWALFILQSGPNAKPDKLSHVQTPLVVQVERLCTTGTWSGRAIAALGGCPKQDWFDWLSSGCVKARSPPRDCVSTRKLTEAALKATLQIS